MKKLMIVASAIAMVIAGQSEILAQSKKLEKIRTKAKIEAEKARVKAYNQKVAEYKADGWKIVGSKTLEVALLDHYDKLADESNREISARFRGPQATTDITVKQNVLTNASAYYASLASTNIKGRIVDSFGANLSEEDMRAFENFYGGYERLVDAEIKGELKESFSVYRTYMDGKNAIKEYETVFIVSEDAASKARIRAWENAMKENEAAQKYAEKVSEFIREGFEVK